MKIPLNLNRDEAQSGKAAQAKILEHALAATKKGDWNARRNVLRHFDPLLTSLAEKRTSDPKRARALVEAGQQGLIVAIKKYKPNMTAERFRILALDYIEARMDKPDAQPGFFARLFDRP